MRRLRSIAPAVALAAVLVGGCAAARGPVDRSVDAVHATNRTVGESVDTMAQSSGNVVVDALTFPFRLIGRVFGALFG